MNITTAANTPTGTRTLTISGLSGSLSHTATATLVVTLQPTTTVLNSSLNPSTYGQPVTFQATVSAPNAPAPNMPPDGDSVTFRNGGVVMGVATLAGGVASFTTNSLNAGSRSITANYLGDNTFASSKSAALAQKVNKAPTATSISSSSDPSAFGQVITFTATVSSAAAAGSPGGTVVFKSGTNVLGSATLSSGGIATLTTAALPAGSDPISTTYTGSPNFLRSGASMIQVVNP